MRKYGLSDGWLFWKTGEKEKGKPVTLPHDAMLSEKRLPASRGGAHISWFEGGDYVYEKTLDWPQLLFDLNGDADLAFEAGSRVIVEFEGVYRNAEVYLNDERIAFHPYGYTHFDVDITPGLITGENRLRVMVHNADQPNSRWYTGSGIYRPVNLMVLPPKHIQRHGVKIKTLDIVHPAIQVSVETNAPGHVGVKIRKKGRDMICYAAEAEAADRVEVVIPMPGADLWSPEQPNLYVCRVDFEGDSEEIVFGIRTMACSAKEGLRINGTRVILRGACIHHDNGLLGAAAEPFAEARKIRLLRKAGYNAIRSAHNPCSKALLDACDAYGMLVLDEYIDMWYIHKTKYDYADDFDAWWQRDIRDMIDKDYNHPSVILYSIGNEVAETSQPRGIRLCAQMTRFIEALDDTRQVTCGINIFFNLLFSMGFGVYSDKKAEKASEVASAKNAVGSEFYNKIAGIAGASFMKLGASLHGSDVKTRDAFANLHIAGYNYGIRRYRKDVKRYADRVILGTETFCADAYAFWELARRHPAIIGDFVWAGMDYLGEAGIGAWEYEEYAPDFSHGVGWITAGSGRLDITGRENGEALYTRVAFELDKIHMAVVPVSRQRRRHSPSAWKMTNAIASWSFNGLDGAPATVEVYARAERVALYLNGDMVGDQRARRDCRFVFKTKYGAGTLEARAFDREGRQIAATALRTAGEETVLTLLPERERVTRGELCYVRIRYTDAHGEIKPLARGIVQVRVKNGSLLGLGNGCAYHAEGYLNAHTDTYYGEALAVIRPSGAGDVTMSADSPYGQARTVIAVDASAL